MYLIILGLSLGLVIGAFLRIDIPPEFARYTAVAIVGVLDSVFGAIRATIKREYNTSIFMTGLLFNIVVAVLITYVGDKLSLDLYLAVLVALMIRIFANIGVIKSQTIDKLWNKSNKIAEGIEK